MVIDTNIIIYAIEPEGEWLRPWTHGLKSAIASISRIEALGFANITNEQEDLIRSLVASLTEYRMDDEIIERAICLRQEKKMGLGDSIIAATALEYDVPLVTRNEADFKHIADLTIINPFATSNPS